MTPLCFVDIETTSLARPFSPTPGEVWEVGLIVRHHDLDGTIGFEEQYRWFLPVTLEHADPVSLDIGRFHDRHPQGDRGPDVPVTPLDLFAAELVALVPDGAHLVGNVVSFDEERLAAILHAHGIDELPWHYHLVDVEALAAGWLATEEQTLDAARPPWNSEALCAALGVDVPSDEDRHTALGDARWARDLYDAVMGPRP